MTLVHAAAFVTAAVVLPWRTSYALSLPLFVLGVLHVAVAALAFSAKKAWFLRAWAALSLASLACLLFFTVYVASTALYLAELYTGIGPGLAAGLVVSWLVAVLFTLPISWWGLALSWPLLRRPRGLRTGSALLVLLALLVPLGASRTARAERVTGGDDPALLERLRAVAERRLRASQKAAESAKDGRRAKAPAESVLSARSLGECAQPIDGERLTLFVGASLRRGKPQLCVQAKSADELVSALDSRLATSELTGKPIRLELVSGRSALRSTQTLLDALKLRPGRDGVCSGKRCLMPWQLVALSSFAAERPIPGVGDAGFGVSFSALRKQLRQSDDAPLVRLETKGLVARADSTARAEQSQPTQGASAAELESALALVERHVERARLATGGFRYTLDPFTSAKDESSVSLPRHAGTTLVSCELGKQGDVRARAKLALDFLKSHERRKDDFLAYSLDPHVARLGHTALPLVALLSCRGLVGGEYDDAIARAGRYLLRMQRPDGSFFPELALDTGAPYGAHQSLYSAGQAVLALVLLAQWAEPPEKGAYRDATERAMQYYAGPYWQRAPYDFFFVEENWHCLAARAALDSHRNDAYERFCLDYVTFKSRLVFDERSGVDDDLIGGYGVSPLFPPHNTATAGFGEALAAAISVRRARHMDVTRELALLRRVLGFLVRHQWRDSDCFACTRRADTLGGFSESSTSPILRIDYAQHAWAALGHGGRELARQGQRD